MDINSRSGRKKNMFLNRLSFVIGRGTYTVLNPFFYIIFRIFLRLKIEGEDLRGKKGPLIVISNHASWIDPFLIGSSFPFASCLFPVRYAVFPLYYYSFLPFMLLTGSFPAKSGISLKSSLRHASKTLDAGGVVGIFPEGRRVSPGEKIRKGKCGAVFLHYAKGAPILPVRIKGNEGMTVKDFLLRRRRVTVKIGKAIHLPRSAKTKADLNVFSENLVRHIYSM